MLTALLLLLLIHTLPAQPDRFGLPACPAEDHLLTIPEAFILCYSPASKIALWTAYELKREHLSAPAARRAHFRQDPRLHHNQATNTDYRLSGYSRGHLVPAADVSWNQEALSASFFLSNAVPQNRSLNSGRWRQLELAARRLSARHDSLIILTGPVFCGTRQFIGPGRVAIPCELFKVILASGDSGLTMYAAILPNGGNPPQPLSHFAASVDDVEQRTNLDFFPALPARIQSTLESNRTALP